MRPSPPATPPLFVRRCLAGRKCGASISTLRCTRLRWKGREAGKRDSGDTLTHGRGWTDGRVAQLSPLLRRLHRLRRRVSQSVGRNREDIVRLRRKDGRTVTFLRTHGPGRDEANTPVQCNGAPLRTVTDVSPSSIPPRRGLRSRQKTRRPRVWPTHGKTFPIGD